MKKRPITTLFMLMSLDGKINSGASDELDVDKDWPFIDGVKEGIHQYYEIEATTDLYSFNSGRVMEKIGVNDSVKDKEKIGVSFVILDRKPHLSESGVKYLANWAKQLFVITDNCEHPAFCLKKQYENINVLYYENGINLSQMLIDLNEQYGIERLTIQSGGTLNGAFLRADLIDYVNVVIAPVLVGGSHTNTLIDGKTLMKREELNLLKAMKLLECETLEDSYLRLKYKVIRD
ncbi:MAG: dihydrofolate reductase family protein [Velocimicrobium sp.]